MDKRKLLKQTLIKFASGVTGLGLILFLSAGTFAWWNAWVFMAVIFLPMTAVGTLLFLKEPELLEKRINMKETEKEQKRVISLTTPLLLAGYIVSGIDFRSGWSHVPYLCRCFLRYSIPWIRTFCLCLKDQFICIPDS